jgi:superfamily II DNA/RNA helicase
MKGRNVLGFARTGSGKTGAFLIPMINKVLNDQNEKVLIVAPTRELAAQISKEAIKFVRGTKLNISLIIGGESTRRQISSLRRGDRFIIGTPGRIKDMINRKHIKAHNINNIIVDEVDRMLDMGFIGDIKHFFKLAPKQKQSLFFSATHNRSVETIARELVNHFDTVKITGNEANTNIDQNVIDYSSQDEKINLLQDLLYRDEVEKAIIFVRTKRYADRINRILSKSDHKSNVIHGGKRQNQRKRVYKAFKYSKFDYLVATNVAARGLDVDDITHVINLDEPDTHEEYIHRVGRTGRNGKTGTAYTFLKR